MFSYFFFFICLTASRKGESSGTSSVEFTSKVSSTTNQDTCKSQVIIHLFQTNLKEGENIPRLLKNLIDINHVKWEKLVIKSKKLT